MRLQAKTHDRVFQVPASGKNLEIGEASRIHRIARIPAGGTVQEAASQLSAGGTGICNESADDIQGQVRSDMGPDSSSTLRHTVR